MNLKIQTYLTKLERLERQISTTRLGEFSYPDSQAALDLLSARLARAVARVRDAESLSPVLQSAIFREANFFIIRATYILGIVVRSSSTRNAFELYVPFLDVCRALVGDDARLLLSSEWQYVPFTYPQTLGELPTFIVIGLPASESDNVLVFPVAGHELGHSVWAKTSTAKEIQPDVSSRINDAFRDNQDKIEEAVPMVRGADFEQDMFVQVLKGDTITAALAQAEETFSDFLGLLLFGESYLHAFEYLIAPQLAGHRAKNYPDTKKRAETLERFARAELRIPIDGYAGAFRADPQTARGFESLQVEITDPVVEAITPALFARARAIIDQAKIACPSPEVTTEVETVFLRGVPFDEAAAIGDLINAAWRVFRAGTGLHAEQGREPVDLLSDLVLKSVEIDEIRKYLA